jgi:hypothetical protein
MRDTRRKTYELRKNQMTPLPILQEAEDTQHGKDANQPGTPPTSTLYVQHISYAGKLGKDLGKDWSKRLRLRSWNGADQAEFKDDQNPSVLIFQSFEGEGRYRCAKDQGLHPNIEALEEEEVHGRLYRRYTYVAPSRSKASRSDAGVTDQGGSSTMHQSAESEASSVPVGSTAPGNLKENTSVGSLRFTPIIEDFPDDIDVYTNRTGVLPRKWEGQKGPTHTAYDEWLKASLLDKFVESALSGSDGIISYQEESVLIPSGASTSRR